MFDVSNQLVVA